MALLPQPWTKTQNSLAPWQRLWQVISTNCFETVSSGKDIFDEWSSSDSSFSSESLFSGDSRVLEVDIDKVVHGSCWSIISSLILITVSWLILAPCSSRLISIYTYIHDYFSYMLFHEIPSAIIFHKAREDDRFYWIVHIIICHNFTSHVLSESPVESTLKKY